LALWTERSRRLALLFGIALAGSGIFWFVFRSASPEVAELDRVASPDGALDLVVSEVLVNATVSTPYRVSVVLHGQIPVEDDLVLNIDQSEKPTVVWVGSDAISVHCRGGRVWFFRNFWTRKNAGRRVSERGNRVGMRRERL
jgi:hypothetical protein